MMDRWDKSCGSIQEDYRIGLERGKVELRRKPGERGALKKTYAAILGWVWQPAWEVERRLGGHGDSLNPGFKMREGQGWQIIKNEESQWYSYSSLFISLDTLSWAIYILLVPDRLKLILTSLLWADVHVVYISYDKFSLLLSLFFFLKMNWKRHWQSLTEVYSIQTASILHVVIFELCS